MLFIAISCNQQKKSNESSSDISNELVRREQALKEKELLLKEKELNLLQEINQANKKNEKKNLSELYKELKKSVFRIYTIDDKENVSQGTAFTIDKTGIALSNYHVFENASEAIAVNEYGDEFLINEIISYSEESDYFAFRLGPNYDNFNFLNITNTPPNIGDECFAIGNPKGLTNTISRGIISGYRENGNLIQTDATITHGSSGGPLFNNNGEVIGITSSGIKGADLNFAIYINSIPISELMELSRKTVALAGNSKTPNFSETEYINKYFSFVQSQQFKKATSMFAESVKRYYGKFNPTNEWIYKSMINYRTNSKITAVVIDIDYDSINSYYSANSTYLIDFYMDYKIERTEKHKPSNFRLKLFMEVNSDNKIVSIYEDIVSKK